jgi:cell division protein FtsZ
MIEYPRATRHRAPNVRIVGLGGAGCRVIERLIEEHVEGANFVALNTDAQALGSSSAPEKIQLGARGIGAGGVPDAGYTAAEESSSLLRESFEGAELVFICVGLGGGTGSGASPLVANIARQAGATVVAFVTLPFSFEGHRRREQADAALAELGTQAHMVFCFENDRMSELVSEAAPAHQAFSVTDGILAQAIRTIAGIVRTDALIRVGLDELTAALERENQRCIFGYGESDSDTRAHDAMDRALRSPLMNRGQSLAEVRDVVINISAGIDLTLAEISVVMELAHRHLPASARIHLGVSANGSNGKLLGISIISASGSDSSEPAKSSTRIPLQRTQSSAPSYTQQVEPRVQDAATEDAGLQNVANDNKKVRAEQMQFEPVNRGRFEKSEPTIVDGQDLDIPTFLRKGLRLR